MIYEILKDVVNWVSSDVSHIALVIGAIVVVGAVRGIYRSLGRARWSRHAGQRLL